MSRSTLLAVAFTLLLMAPLVSLAAPNPGISGGYLDGQPRSGDVDNGDSYTYFFIIDVQAPDGESTVHLDMDYLPGEDRIQPRSQIAIRPGGSSGSFHDIGTLSGSEQVLREPHLLEGRYSVRVQATVSAPEEGDYETLLRFVARDVDQISASPGVIIKHDFNVIGDPPSPPSTPTQSPQPQPDPPGQVTGLRLVEVSARQAVIGWNAVEGASHYQVHRAQTPSFPAAPGNLVEITQGIQVTDGPLTPDSAYYYRVRAVDSEGEVGLASPALEVRTLEEEATEAPATIFGFQVESGDTVVASWRTDASVDSLIRFGRTPQDQETIEAGTGTSFEADLGPLAPGSYSYRIEAAAEGRQTGIQEGRFLIRANEVAYKSQAPATTEAQLVGMGVPLPENSLYFVDEEGDGQIDAVEDASGALDPVHGIPTQALFLLRSNIQFVLVDVSQDAVHPVTPLGGDTVNVVDGASSSVAFIEVVDKSGWIYVSTPDYRPGQNITGFYRGSTPLPTEMVWRSGGQLFFLDDPEQSYTIEYEADPDAQQPAVDEGGAEEEAFDWQWLVMGGLALAVVVLLLVVVRNGRKRS